MAEVAWGEEAAPPPKKSGIPSWVWWGCGIGCLLALLVAGGLAFMVGSLVSDATDPEVVWPQVNELLPFDQRPEGYEAGGMGLFGTGTYILSAKSGDHVLIVQKFPNAEALARLYDPETIENKGLFGVGGIRDAEHGEIVVQGRVAPCLRFFAWVPEGKDSKTPPGASIRVNVTGQGSIPVSVQITLVAAEGRVGDERVAEILAPFDVWRGR
jgi:hypothetical protein